MIKNTTLSALTALTLASPALYAAAEPFTGPSIAIGASLGGLANQTDTSPSYKQFVTRALTGKPYSNSDNTQDSVLPIVDLSWNVPIAPSWIAGAGINLETGERTGPENIVSYAPAVGAQSASLTMKQHTAVYGLIGKQLGENWLLYGKLGYHQAKADSKYQFSARVPELDKQQRFTLHGTGIGIGATRAWKNGLELRMEGEYIAFNEYTHTVLDKGDTVTGKPALSRVNVMLGYRF
ncbi:MAG: outer membrane beta-barrel protein [Paludibacterium sp.]|uniref:outer membrane beta-barrel protein n=1 Tax=Paludibacterium sp. TaxID=1917523 RepID=UPI0025EFCEB0|nr:outer membrane beta-barrel protein [Paludibacterium sp.]MBV8046749.1 outer membrane beta-barrel protein [Paludibacterium sp.]MBV8649366.1 outer membrane beta-barrel protein [Paludibacterium sp.]